MYFPVADIRIGFWVPPLTAFVISFFTSMGGVSGAFLLLPFQMSVLHFDSPAVSATNHIFNVVAIPSGVYRYIREKRMVWPLTWAVILGTLPGVLAGALVRIRYLPDPTTFKRFAALVLLYIGLRLVENIWRSRRQSGKGGSLQTAGEVTGQRFSLQEISYTYQDKQYSVSTGALFLLSLVVGMLGGIYGIGGGAIMAPFLVTVFGLPVHTVAGAALMGTMITSVAGVAFFQVMAPFYPQVAVGPDWLLGFMFGLGGLLGMYCGARMQRYVPTRLIKSILALCILFTAVRYLGLF